MHAVTPGTPVTRCAGQAMLEYLLVTAAIAAAMFVPMAFADNMSVADYLARAVRSFFRGYSFLVSVS